MAPTCLSLESNLSPTIHRLYTFTRPRLRRNHILLTLFPRLRGIQPPCLLGVRAAGLLQYVHLHPSDRFNLDQNYTYPTKREALAKTKDLLEQWLMELDDC